MIVKSKISCRDIVFMWDFCGRNVFERTLIGCQYIPGTWLIPLWIEPTSTHYVGLIAYILVYCANSPAIVWINIAGASFKKRLIGCRYVRSAWLVCYHRSFTPHNLSIMILHRTYRHRFLSIAVGMARFTLGKRWLDVNTCKKLEWCSGIGHPRNTTSMSRHQIGLTYSNSGCCR